MMIYSESLQELIKEFKKMPGIGEKNAQRLAFYVLQISNEQAQKLSMAIINLKTRIRYCSICSNLTEVDPCAICHNPSRDHSLICVVEDPKALIAIEKTGQYKGVYHVLMGTLSPLDNIGPDDIRIKELMTRVEKNDVKEVIMGTSPNMEGETTSLYIARLLSPLGIKITRLARGVPIGTDIEYADEITLLNALEGRTKF
ncbi:MAG: recombination protein RecR [Candidatus Schekmanbacteria bacterium]|nr:recombination protein RecR [Candidatus Schekmanbacteria bacterium]